MNKNHNRSASNNKQHIRLQFWRLESGNQAVPRAMLPLRGRILPCILLTSGSFWPQGGLLGVPWLAVTALSFYLRLHKAFFPVRASLCGMSFYDDRSLDSEILIQYDFTFSQLIISAKTLFPRRPHPQVLGGHVFGGTRFKSLKAYLNQYYTFACLLLLHPTKI